MSKEVGFPLQDLVDWNTVEKAVHTSKDKRNHLVDSHGLVLFLLEQFGETFTTAESLLGSSVQIRAELGEGSNLTVLSQEELQATSNLLHCLELGSRADARHRETDVNSWPDTFVEELRLQENLSVGDGNDIGGYISRHISTLRLDNGKSCKRTTPVLIVQLGSTLQKPRVEIEDTKQKLAFQIYFAGISNVLSRVSLTPRRATEKERHLTISHGLLGKIIIDDDGVFPIVAEPFTHGATSERRNVLERSSLRGSSSNNDSVFHGIVFFERLDELSNCGALLADSNVDAVELFGLVITVVPSFLI